jgi:hypothetical protein
VRQREKYTRKEFNDEEWTVVVPRRRRDGRYGKGKEDGKARVISFYFTNFPDEVSLHELRHRFTRIGEVVDIFIPGKKNKYGKFFGFVRFKGIEETTAAEERMREIWFGTYKMWANVARFAKEGGNHKEHGQKRLTSDGRNRESVIKSRRQIDATEKPRNYGRDRNINKTGNMSYADAVGRQARKNGEGKQNVDINKSQKNHEEKREWNGTSFETAEEDRDWAKRGLVGVVNHVDEVPLLQQKILDVGITTVKIIPMGGKKVFIQPLEDEDLRDLIKDAEEFFNHWFIKIKDWNPKETSTDRTIWLRLYGVPVHAWRENFFKKVLEFTGEVIVLDEDTCKKRRLDYARVLIRTSVPSLINQVEKVKIDNDFFVVRMLEEVNVNFCPIKVVENQISQQSEDEESNRQWWITQNVEEEEEGEVNSQNLEREYSTFNENWEEGKNMVSGGAITEFQEKAFNSVIPKKVQQSVVGDRERKDNHASTIKEGSHATSKESLFLENIGLVFTGIVGSVIRPNMEVFNLENLGNGSENLIRVHNVQQQSSPNHQTFPNQTQQQCIVFHHIQRNTDQQENNSNQQYFSDCDSGTGERHQNQSFDCQQQQSSDYSIMEGPQLQNRPLYAEESLASEQPVEKTHKMDELKRRRRRRPIPKLKDLARAKAKKMRKKKRKQERKTAASNGSEEISDSSNQVNTSSNSSCSKEISEWRKWVLLHEEPGELASNVWEFGRKEGITFSGDEGGVVKELEGIEIRDREKMVANNSKCNQGAESNKCGL